jgi:anti-repressor protein
MEEIKLFKNERFGEIRVIELNGKQYFMASDVAKALGYSNPRDAVIRHCNTRGVVKHDTPINGVIQQVTYIDEGNVYRLIAKSELPGAEAFESWIFDNVLPSIRETGVYATPATIDAIIADPEFGIKLLLSLKGEREKRLEAEKTITEQAPKVLFADAVATSDKSCLIGELAKVLRQNGVEIGQNRLFKWMRKNGYLCSVGERHNQPTQRAIEMGLFEIKERAILKSDGVEMITFTTKVTGKGQIYFVNKFLRETGLALAN